jgi:Holliday junction resolvase-like predicted endonuclease
MIRVRFIKDGNEGIRSRWRYKTGDEDLLQDSFAREAIEDGIAIEVPRVERGTNRVAMNAITEAKKRSLNDLP